MSMTVAEAAKAWEEEKRELAVRTPRLEAAAKVLKEYFHTHPDKRDYKGRIGFSTQVRTSMDNEAVKAELGDRLPEFQKRFEVEILSLLT